MVYALVKDDTAPQVKATLTRDDTGAAIDCSGGTVRMYFRAKGGSSILFTLTAADAGTDLANGIAIFGFSGSNLDQPEGYYEGEIEITYSDGNVETIFEVLDFYIRADF